MKLNLFTLLLVIVICGIVYIKYYAEKLKNKVLTAFYSSNSLLAKKVNINLIVLHYEDCIKKLKYEWRIYPKEDIDPSLYLIRQRFSEEPVARKMKEFLDWMVKKMNVKELMTNQRSLYANLFITMLFFCKADSLHG